MGEDRANRAILLINNHYNYWKHFGDSVRHHHQEITNSNKPFCDFARRGRLACWNFRHAASCFRFLGR